MEKKLRINRSHYLSYKLMWCWQNSEQWKLILIYGKSIVTPMWYKRMIPNLCFCTSSLIRVAIWQLTDEGVGSYQTSPSARCWQKTQGERSANHFTLARWGLCAWPQLHEEARTNRNIWPANKVVGEKHITAWRRTYAGKHTDLYFHQNRNL